MIDPRDLNNVVWNETTGQEFLLFCLAVAGKSALTIAPKIHQLCYETPYAKPTPFYTIKEMIAQNVLRSEMEKVKLGKYSLLTKAYSHIVDFDLPNITCDMLEQVPGIGPKTARFFLVYYKGLNNVAIIDTHIKKWLLKLGYEISKDYSINERNFLLESKKRNISVRELDLAIWKDYNEKGYTDIQ